MILRGPWTAGAGNLDIPIGISRFLSLPGPHGFLKNQENHKIPLQSIFSVPNQVFPLLELKKLAQNVTFIKGFWQGPPTSISGPPDANSVPQSIKARILSDSIGSYRIIASQPASQPWSAAIGYP